MNKFRKGNNHRSQPNNSTHQEIGVNMYIQYIANNQKSEPTSFLFPSEGITAPKLYNYTTTDMITIHHSGQYLKRPCSKIISQNNELTTSEPLLQNGLKFNIFLFYILSILLAKILSRIPVVFKNVRIKMCIL